MLCLLSEVGERNALCDNQEEPEDISELAKYI